MSNPVFENLMGDVLRALPVLQGWCKPDKAACLVKYILAEQPELVVEIGCFGGSSFVPMLMALRSNGFGHAHGIDPWAVEASLENMNSEVNRTWWGALDMEAIYQGLVRYLKDNGLTNYATLHKMKSKDAVSQFADESIGLLHIDGNHSEEQSFADATLWLPKVRTGATVIFDDIFWTDGTDHVTTRRAVLFLLEHCERVDAVGDCMFFRKRPQ